MPNLGAMEILLILFIILLLFGAAKLPDLARSLGRSARIFKSEVNEMQNDGKPADGAADSAPQANQAPQSQQPLPPREITAGNNNTAYNPQQSAEQGFWDRPENQPRTNPNN